MEHNWSLAGVTGDLPPDFLGSEEAQEIARVHKNTLQGLATQRVGAPSDIETRDARSEILTERLDIWLEKYDRRATELLAELSPRTTLNLNCFESACRRLRGRPPAIKVPMRRWVWIVASAGGQDDARIGSGLAEFIQAALDYRNLSLVQNIVRPIFTPTADSLTAMDHDQLIGSRIRFGWMAAKVARAISEVAPTILPPDPLEGLISYIHDMATSQKWIIGDSENLHSDAADLAKEMSINPGELSGQRFSSLNSSIKATTLPFAEIDNVLLPVGLESATTRFHLPVINYVRRQLKPNQSSKVMEQACERILSTCPELNTLVGNINLRVSETNEGEMDVVGIDHQRNNFLDIELKSHFERDILPTTGKSFRQGIEESADQISKRRRAFKIGGIPTYENQPLRLREDTKFVGLAVVLHDYSGLIWRPRIPGKGLGCNVITITDLALITTVMESDDELFEYLDLRERILAAGEGATGDEIDLLALFLEYDYQALSTQLPKPGGRQMVLVPPRSAPLSLFEGMKEPKREQARKIIANLPRLPL